MDILRLILLMGLLLYGAAATECARQAIRGDRAPVELSSALTDEDTRYLKQVAGLASVQPASIVVQDGMLLGTGHDRVIETFDPTAHAETEAIRDACKRTKKIVLNEGVLYASRQPCSMCMRVIAHTGITRVVIGSESDSSSRTAIVY